MTDTTTWVLLLFLGFTPPLDIHGFASREACEAAGKYAVDHWTGTKAYAHCIPGPAHG